MGASNPINWFEIYVQDMDRAKHFYQTVFATQLSELLSGDEVSMWAFPMDMDKPGSSGALIHMPGFPSGGNCTLVYFYSTDCAVEASRIARAGGRVFKEKFSIGQYGFIALGYDTEGNMFGIHSTQ